METNHALQMETARNVMEPKHAAQIDRLRNKLDKLLGICQRYPSFAKDHWIVAPSPPLTEAELERFELEHGIQLPEDYREFVAAIAHGGPGPYHGILPLDGWAEAAPWLAEDVPGDYLSAPCPLRPDMARDEHWYAALGCSHPRRYQGAMTVSRQGGTRYCLLIVAGPSRGRIVLADIAQGVPRFAPQMKFLDWYEDWLDETLESAEFEVC